MPFKAKIYSTPEDDPCHPANDKYTYRWALCMNCLRTWKTRSEKHTVKCPGCRSHTSNICCTLEECYTNYEPVMCPRCHYIWFTKARTKRIECWRCRKRKEKRSVRLKDTFQITFIRSFNTDPNGTRELLMARFPKARHIISKWISPNERREKELGLNK